VSKHDYPSHRRRLLRQAALRLSEQSGFALVMALGALVVLSIVGTTLVEYATSNAGNASRSGADQAAYALAEGGANAGAGVLVNNAHPDVWTGHPTQASPATITYSNGTVSWWASSLSCAPEACWKISAKSTVRNPTGPKAAAVHRTVSISMKVVRHHTNGSNVGNYIYADGDIKVDGGAAIQEPIIAGGNLDMSASSSANFIMSISQLISVRGQIKTNLGYIGNGPTTTLTAPINASSSSILVADATAFASSGTLKIDNEWMKYKSHNPTSFSIATDCGTGTALCRGFGGYGAPPAASHSTGAVADGRLHEIHAALGCSPLACNLVARLFSATTPDTTPISFTKPTFDQTQAFANAAPGPKSTNTCTGTSPTGSFSTFFDNQSPASAILDHSISTPINLTGSVYDCIATAPNGTTGEIKWNGTTLTVHGTVFFDGDITVGSDLTYSSGSAGATIWTSGSFSNMKQAMCAVGTAPACDFNSWDPSANNLGIVAHTFAGSTNSHCVNFSAGGKFQGVIYADGGGCGTMYGFDEAAGARVQGLVISSSVHLSGDAGTPAPAIAYLPDGFPGVDLYDVSEIDGGYGE